MLLCQQDYLLEKLLLNFNENLVRVNFAPRKKRLQFGTSEIIPLPEISYCYQFRTSPRWRHQILPTPRNSP